MNRAMKVAVLLALAASLALAACGGSDNGTSAGTATSGSGSSGQATTEGAAGGTEGEGAATTIVVKNGEPVGGVQELEYTAGEQIRFTVDSDVADEVHVHGYDLMKDVPAGGSVSFSFPAEIEGIFEVELEKHQEQIAELRVNP
jgi:plastocyanin